MDDEPFKNTSSRSSESAKSAWLSGRPLHAIAAIPAETSRADAVVRIGGDTPVAPASCPLAFSASWNVALANDDDADDDDDDAKATTTLTRCSSHA